MGWVDRSCLLDRSTACKWLIYSLCSLEISSTSYRSYWKFCPSSCQTKDWWSCGCFFFFFCCPLCTAERQQQTICFTTIAQLQLESGFHWLSWQQNVTLDFNLLMQGVCIELLANATVSPILEGWVGIWYWDWSLLYTFFLLVGSFHQGPIKPSLG